MEVHDDEAEDVTGLWGLWRIPREIQDARG
jgi:hypothetical protein